MDCGEFYVIHDVMLFCLQVEVIASDIRSISLELSAIRIYNHQHIRNIQDSTYKILMDCDKFHVKCEVMLFLSMDRSICQLYSHRLSHCSYMEQ